VKGEEDVNLAQELVQDPKAAFATIITRGVN